MKKKVNLFLHVIFFIIVLLLISTLFFYIFYIQKFSSSIRPITTAEEQNVINILSKNIDIRGYKIEFGNVFIINNTQLAQVKLVNSTFTKSYAVDIQNQKVIKK